MLPSKKPSRKRKANDEDQKHHMPLLGLAQIHKELQGDGENRPLLTFEGLPIPYPEVLGGAKQPGELLRRLLHPVEVDEFMSTCFRRKVLAVQLPWEGDGGPGPTRVRRLVKDLLCDLDVERLLAGTASDAVFVWVVDPTTAKIRTVELQDSGLAAHMYRAGHSTYCRAPPAAERALVGRLMSDVGIGLPGVPVNTSDLGRGEVELFCSKKGHVTDFHFDFQENFTVQLSGRKRWKLRGSGVRHPLRGCTPHYDSPEVVEQQVKVHRLQDPQFTFGLSRDEASDVDEVVLRPGDVLYHPAGTWHRCEALEDSISINISIMATPWAGVITDGLMHLLWRQEASRAMVSGRGPSEMRANLAAALEAAKRVMAGLTVDDLLPPCLLRPPLPRWSEDELAAGDGGVTEAAAPPGGGDCVSRAENGGHDAGGKGQEEEAGGGGAEEEEEKGEEGDGEEEDEEEEGEGARTLVLNLGSGKVPWSLDGLVPSSRFRFNALATLLRASDATAAPAATTATTTPRSAQVQGASLSEARATPFKSSGADGGSPVDGEGDSDSAEEAQYIGHVNFGNASLESLVRVGLVAPGACFRGVMEALCGAMGRRREETFCAGDVSPPGPEGFAATRRVLEALEYCGIVQSVPGGSAAVTGAPRGTA